ncbi:MAG: helix-turn-helix domain-containing protein [Chlamydiales bacterium]
MEQALIGKIVHFHRKQSGLSQTELAKLAGLGKTVIFDIEKGKSTIRVDTLLKVLNVLNIRLDFSGPLMAKFYEALDEKS